MMKLYLAIGAAAAVLVVGFTAGWRAQGARYERKLAAMEARAIRAESNYAQAVTNRQACEEQIGKLQAAVADYIKAGDQARLEAAEAAKRALAERRRWEARIASMQTVPLPETCEPAVREIARRIQEVERARN